MEDLHRESECAHTTKRYVAKALHTVQRLPLFLRLFSTNINQSKTNPQLRRGKAMALELTGLHHLTAITADAPANHRFYTGTLGLRLVKKTVNQDDTSAYHLFYADGLATPGSDITFFDWPVEPERRGTRSIVRTLSRLQAARHLIWKTLKASACG